MLTGVLEELTRVLLVTFLDELLEEPRIAEEDTVPDLGADGAAAALLDGRVVVGLPGPEVPIETVVAMDMEVVVEELLGPGAVIEPPVGKLADEGVADETDGDDKYDELLNIEAEDVMLDVKLIEFAPPYEPGPGSAPVDEVEVRLVEDALLYRPGTDIAAVDELELELILELTERTLLVAAEDEVLLDGGTETAILELGLDMAEPAP